MHELERQFPPRDARLRYRYAIPEGEQPSTAVVNAVEAAGVDAPGRESRLWDAVEGDALDLLFGALDDGIPRDGGLVIFPLWGFIVVTDAEEEVTVYEPTGE